MRIGVLGAARIVPMGLLRPARATSGVSVMAVAARDAQRAQAFALTYEIPRVCTWTTSHSSPTPRSMRFTFRFRRLFPATRRALEARKHVLCEKPFAANATEAQTDGDAANHSGLVVMEAFHYRYHPLAARIVDIAQSGEIGVLTRLSATFCVPLPSGRNIRWQEPLGGGATMDVGCYPTHLLRHATGEEPTVTSATAKNLQRQRGPLPQGATHLPIGRKRGGPVGALGVPSPVVLTDTDRNTGFAAGAKPLPSAGVSLFRRPRWRRSPAGAVQSAPDVSLPTGSIPSRHRRRQANSHRTRRRHSQQDRHRCRKPSGRPATPATTQPHAT